MVWCIFCRILEGQSPSRLILEDDQVYAFHDMNPQAPVHALVIPRHHIASVADLTVEDGPLLARLFDVSNQVARKLGIAETGYRVVVNCGPGAGQSVYHLHFHVLGGRPLRWPPG